jgi:hypothetical protein
VWGHTRTPLELKDIVAAERTGNAFLVWRAGSPGPQHLLQLEPDRWRVTIGRDESADVSLSWDAEVSRTHALLERVGTGWTLVDDGLSRNGTFVNGSRVLGRRRLLDGDRVRAGAIEIIYREPVVAAGQSTATNTWTTLQISLTPMQRKVLIALCRPVHEGVSTIPATNRQIAEEVVLSVDGVKAHMRALFDRCGLSELPQNEKRARLVATALVSGLIDPREFRADTGGRAGKPRAGRHAP